MKVTLIQHTPEPEKLIAAAAKLCYSDSSCENIMDGLDEEKTINFVKMLSVWVMKVLLSIFHLHLVLMEFLVLCWLKLQDTG